jgi:hypothetical protein
VREEEEKLIGKADVSLLLDGRLEVKRLRLLVRRW